MTTRQKSCLAEPHLYLLSRWVLYNKHTNSSEGSLSVRIGVDVGGTFTDFTLLDQTNGSVYFFKLPSTPEDPSEAIERGLKLVLEEYSIAAERVLYFAHGTTIA